MSIFKTQFIENILSENPNLLGTNSTFNFNFKMYNISF